MSRGDANYSNIILFSVALSLVLRMQLGATSILENCTKTLNFALLDRLNYKVPAVESHRVLISQVSPTG